MASQSENQTLQLVKQIRESQDREEKQATEMRSDLVGLRTDVGAVSTKVAAIEMTVAKTEGKVESVHQDMMGSGGEPRLRERVLKVEGKVEIHEGRLNEMDSRKWQLWMVLIGALIVPIIGWMVWSMIRAANEVKP